MSKPTSFEYESVSLVDYLRILRKRARTFWIVFGAVVLIALFIALTSYSAESKSEAILTLGHVKGTSYETAEEIADFLSITYPDISVRQGETTMILKLTAKAPSLKEANEMLKKAADDIIVRHQAIYTKQTDRIDQKIKAVQQKIQENQANMERFQTIVNQLSLANEVNAIALQGYLSTISSATTRGDRLTETLEILESKKEDYTQTEYKGITPMVSSSPWSQAGIVLLLGIIIATILAAFGALFAEWWAKSKLF